MCIVMNTIIFLLSVASLIQSAPVEKAYQFSRHRGPLRRVLPLGGIVDAVADAINGVLGAVSVASADGLFGILGGSDSRLGGLLANIIDVVSIGVDIVTEVITVILSGGDLFGGLDSFDW